MKKITSVLIVICLAAFLLLFTAHGHGQSHAKGTSSEDSDFNAFLPKWEQAINRFINGDPSLWKQICSKSDDATILGGFGGYGEKGWNKVNARYDWAASQFKESGAKIEVEYINKVVSGDLAYILVIERSLVQNANMLQKTQQILRSTQIFRKENGQWKLLHRHADPLLEKKAP